MGWRFLHLRLPGQGIDHRRAHVRVPYQLLHRENVSVPLQQGRVEIEAQGVHRNGLANAPPEPQRRENQMSQLIPALHTKRFKVSARLLLC